MNFRQLGIIAYVLADYDSRNEALTASHTIKNYAMILRLQNFIQTKKLLILDEAHRLPEEVVNFFEYNITRNKWRSYIKYFSIPKIDIDDIRGWIEFLITLQRKLLTMPITYC